MREAGISPSRGFQQGHGEHEASDGAVVRAFARETGVAAVPRLVPPMGPSAPAVLYGQDTEPSSRDSRRRRALATADVIGLACAYLLMLAVGGTPHPSPWIVLGLPLWIAANKSLRLYDRDANLVHKSTLNELPKLFQSITFGAAAAFLAAPVVAGLPDDRRDVLLLWAFACVLVPVLRWCARQGVRLTTAPERVLIVGSGHVAELVARKLEQHAEYGTTTIGYVDVPLDREPLIDTSIAHLGGVADFEDVCNRENVERVIIAFSSLTHESLLDMIRVAKRLHVKISVVPRLFEVIGHNVEIDQIEGMTLLGIRGLGRTASTLMLKRGMDILGAAALLFLTMPLLIAVAIAVKLDSPGPVLFVQRRMGRGNAPFSMFKFRTMVDGADAMKSEVAHLNELSDDRMFKIADDPRITRVGRFLRATSIDELPQILNVLRGEMSLVGPRPLIPDETEHVIGWHRARLDLTPGLTGPWQVMGRNAIPFEEMVKLDYLYVADWSLWNDVKLLVRTLPVVFGRRGS